jgi:hypothetical protein
LLALLKRCVIGEPNDKRNVNAFVVRDVAVTVVPVFVEGMSMITDDNYNSFVKFAPLLKCVEKIPEFFVKVFDLLSVVTF